jgi:hypothetical protein
MSLSSPYVVSSFEAFFSPGKYTIFGAYGDVPDAISRKVARNNFLLGQKRVDLRVVWPL